MYCRDLQLQHTKQELLLERHPAHCLLGYWSDAAAVFVQQQQLWCERKWNQDRAAKAELYTLQRLIIYFYLSERNRLLNKGRRWAIK